MFSRTGKYKTYLRKIEELFQKVEEPRDTYAITEYVRLDENEGISMVCKEDRVIIVLGKGIITARRMMVACYEVNRMIDAKPEKYFTAIIA